MSLLRWLLVVPLGIAGVFLAFGVVIALKSGAAHLCPVGLLVSGACTASWYPIVEAIALCIGAALGASSAVFLPYVTAPSHKIHVAVLALVLGSSYAAWLFVRTGTSLLLPFLCALAGGAAVLRLVIFRRRRT